MFFCFAHFVFVFFFILFLFSFALALYFQSQLRDFVDALCIACNRKSSMVPFLPPHRYREREAQPIFDVGIYAMSFVIDAQRLFFFAWSISIYTHMHSIEFHFWVGSAIRCIQTNIFAFKNFVRSTKILFVPFFFFVDFHVDLFVQLMIKHILEHMYIRIDIEMTRYRFVVIVVMDLYPDPVLNERLS